MRRAAIVFGLFLVCASHALAETKSVQGPAGKLAVDDGGQGGVPVVLVHGNGARKEQWAAQLEHLRKSRRAVALDLRGQGASEPASDASYTPEAAAADVAAVAEALGLERFVLAGHSYGAAVATAYAGRHPERVAALLLVDGAGAVNRIPEEKRKAFMTQLDTPQYEPILEQWFGQILTGSSPEVQQQVLASMRSTPRDVFLGFLGSVGDFDPVAALERYRGPVLAIVAERNQADVTMLHNVLPERVPHKTMSGVSHWLMMDRPAEFNALLDEFLGQVDPGP
jgi:pimeloyl-ACP methyl ester carboxylesterase